MNKLYEIVDGRVQLNLHAGQTRVWDSAARIVAMIAGSQSGKTATGPWWLWREIETRGAGDYLAVTSSYDLARLKMIPALREVFERALRCGRYWSNARLIEIADPETGKFLARRVDDEMYARILLRSAVSREGLEAATANAAWLDEAGQDEFTVEAWEAIRRRLALAQGRVLITTTPYNLGWLKQQIADRDGLDGIEVISFESIANPAFSVEEYESLRDSLPAWKFAMFHQGRFERPAGLIYADFINRYREDGGHRVRPFALDPDWKRYVGVDPGFANFCLVWLAHDPEADVFYLYRESLTGRKTTREHAEDAFALAHAAGEDVACWGVGAKSEGFHREDWIAAGASRYAVVEPEIPDVEAGIDRIIGLFRSRRLFIFDTCAGTLDQLGSYTRVLDSSGEPTPEIRDKARFHYLDGLRYAVGAFGKRPQPPTVRVYRYA